MSSLEKFEVGAMGLERIKPLRLFARPSMGAAQQRSVPTYLFRVSRPATSTGLSVPTEVNVPPVVSDVDLINELRGAKLRKSGFPEQPSI